MNQKTNKSVNGKFRIRLGMVTMAVGLLIFLIGAMPDMFGLDRSPVIGFVQIAVFLFGLAIICLGAYISMNSLWNKHQKTILADIGLRLVATGFLIAVISGMADVFGFGTQLSPQIPFYGPRQAAGVLFGEIIIVIGFIFQIPFKFGSDIAREENRDSENSHIDMVFE
ncbi:MAG: hypothetical protein JSW42_03610 [Chloroflexota bacterium]|nr:MAG: hypothetical protein JSW42_03610 [Chloroflexota bacterium]